MPDSHRYHFTLPKTPRPPEIVLNDPWYPGVQQYWPTCTTNRLVNPIDGVVAIVIHAMAGASSSGAVSVMKQPKDPASFHWLVPDEDEPQHGQFVWACVPEALAAWHVRSAASHPDVNGGEKRVNHWSLGIEVVNLQKNDPFSAWQIEATARVVRYCWAKYPKLEHVVSHAKLDSTRRSDPGIEFDWERFQHLVLASVPEPVPELVSAATPLSQVLGSQGSSCCDP
ncbi:N-acetylmuramoyl-L-alanine amidase [Rhizobacter sp. Root16D2]|uniref:N-acetylmuramoyl-L-alanine amidase n=1 Tax=Rhizobacter sp. Root16D2 TaxID=1736479 RepID=UPI0006F2E02F|nr:N-acetylmuramoyl-L-alanine amidase [Rhizobacter sp. Root16D2]KRB24771.1 N-acetylmuramoyl-L-alanine amidase [Rhizobacter sp. Root16D2]